MKNFENVELQAEIKISQNFITTANFKKKLVNKKEVHNGSFQSYSKDDLLR